MKSSNEDSVQPSDERQEGFLRVSSVARLDRLMVQEFPVIVKHNRHLGYSTSSKPVYSINSINHDDLLGYQTAEESADLKEGIDHCESTKGTVQDDLHQAQLVAEEERGTTFLKSVKQHRAAVAWSVLLSTAIIMEGYDMKLLDPSMPSQLLRSGMDISF
ncbi:hypothetical protein NW765_014390 [Fusarium oxysporum]|nr:hypothetical protein NW765_014390 [Fusarium oxysporum]